MANNKIMSVQEMDRRSEGYGTGYDVVQVKMLVWIDRDRVWIPNKVDRVSMGELTDYSMLNIEVTSGEEAVQVEEEEWRLLWRLPGYLGDKGLNSYPRDEIRRDKIATRAVGLRRLGSGNMDWDKDYVLQGMPPEALMRYFNTKQLVEDRPAVTAVSGFDVGVLEFGVRKRLKDGSV